MNVRNERGFSLVEVVMATRILIIGIGMVGAITTGILQKNFYSQRHTQAEGFLAKRFAVRKFTMR